MMPAPAIVTGYGPRLTVDLGAIIRNWQALDKVSAGALTGAAVKADAYGVGLVPASKALFAAGARFFFVATADEGLALRAALPECYIFVLNGLYPGAASLYVGERLMPVINSLPMLEEWLVACLGRNEALPAALHFDTGMNRLGFRLNETSIVKRMCEEVGYAPQMVMSHLACADQPQHEKNRTQLALFSAVINQFPGIPASLANSAATMTSREMHFQMVRPGIALYGGRAVNGRRNPMASVVTLEAPILQVRDCKTGESIGYGATYILPRDTRVAIVALGYADGFLRSLSSWSLGSRFGEATRRPEPTPSDPARRWCVYWRSRPKGRSSPQRLVLPVSPRSCKRSLGCPTTIRSFAQDCGTGCMNCPMSAPSSSLASGWCRRRCSSNSRSTCVPTRRTCSCSTCSATRLPTSSAS